MPNYESLSASMAQRIQQDRLNGTLPQMGADDSDVLRRRPVAKDQASIWRPAYVHDIDKIMHCPYYRKFVQGR